MITVDLYASALCLSYTFKCYIFHVDNRVDVFHCTHAVKTDYVSASVEVNANDINLS